ncbi:MAG TPA: DMT family transporter [Thermomicrobiales bacterium]|nr:DMT family transporter [Thermomicrobiales bacterium]
MAGATTTIAGALMVLTWGSSSVATKVGMGGYDPGQLTLLRFLITSAVMIAFAFATRMRLPDRGDILPLVGLGLVGVSITQFAWAYGMKDVDPGTGTFLFATVPVMAAVIAWLVLGERLSVAGWTGMALTVVGTTVLVLGQGQGVDFTRGALILLLGAFAEAWYYILQKPFLRRYTGIEVSTWALIAATLPMLLFLPGLGGQVASASAVETGSVIYVALGTGVVGYACMAIVNSRVPASVAAVLMAGLPPVALVTAWVWLGTVPPMLSILGGLVSLAGMLLTTLRGSTKATLGGDTNTVVVPSGD